MKRLLSLNLALVMLFSLFPAMTVASAAGGDTGYAVFYRNDGSETTTTVEVVQLSSNGVLQLYYATPEYTADDKVVTSYNTEENGEGTEYGLSTQIGEVFSSDPENPAELYAQWEEAPGNHILYLSTSGVNEQGKDYILQSGLTDTATLPAEDAFEPGNGEKVVGWSKQPSYRFGTIYQCGETIDLSGDLTLYSITGVNCITLHYPIYNYTTGTYHNREKVVVYTGESEEIGQSNASTYLNDRIFVGWNSAEDGSGTWYTTNDLAIDAPQDLYAQYEEYPDGSYYILNAGGNGLLNGQQRDVIELPEDGQVSLPQELRNGAVAAYWRDTTNDLSYPAGKPVAVKSGTTVSATVVRMTNYYGIVDGNGGVTASGSKYDAIFCCVTSAGDLSVYSFIDAAKFTNEAGSVSGYKGEKTGTIYDANDDMWDAMAAEADENHMASFTVQYQAVNGGYIQYFGNGTWTQAGASSVVQDGLDFAALAGEKILSNPFTAPNGKYFIGWNTKSNGYGTWYDAGDVIDLTGNTLLFAQWGTNRVTYHYTRNQNEQETVYKNGRISSMFSGEGLFEGWNTAKDGSGTWYYPGDEIPDGTILELYEQRASLPEEGFYYVLHDARPIGGKLVEIITLESETATIKLPEFGLGWIRSDGEIYSAGFVDAEEDIYLPGSELEITSGTELSQLKPSITVEYHSNYEGYEATRVYYDLVSHHELVLHSADDVFDTLPADTSFDAWTTKADASGTRYAKDSVVSDGEYTLYAQWDGASPAETVDSGTCGDNLTWTLDSDGVLTISGSGAMSDYEYGDAPWYGKRNSIKTVVVEPGVTTIGDSAFDYCTGLTSVDIPDSVTTIGSWAFSGCTGLTAVTIPDSVTTIGRSAFSICTGLTSVIIPDSVTSIGQGAFLDCTKLTLVTIPDSVTTIGRYPFSGCTGLKTAGPIGGNYSIQFGWADAIPANAFWNCSGLTSVTIPDSVTSIGGSAFEGCTGLTAVTIPDSVTSIGQGAFLNCTKLTSVIIPDSVTTIGERAFRGCTGLKTVTIPDSVTSIRGGAFSNCTKLEAFSVARDSSAYAAADGVLFTKDMKTLVCYPPKKEGTEYTVPSGVTAIEACAFEYCSALVSVTLPAGLTVIGGSAFRDCTGLTAVTIPDSVTTIGSSAFSGCTGLTAVTIPDSVTYVGHIAFAGCQSLKTVVIPAGVTSIGYNAFAWCQSLTSVTIPDSVTSIGQGAFLNCTKLTAIQIPAGVTTIGSDAFANTGLTAVTIPDSVTTIGRSAFSDCTGLTAVTIPDSVTSIGQGAFLNCTKLTAIQIPAGVTTIGSDAFANTGLTDLYYLGSQEQWTTLTASVKSLLPDGVTVHYGSEMPPLKNGLQQDGDGVWRYYAAGVVDTEYTDLVDYYGNKFYVANGVLDNTYTGLVFHDGSWCYVSGGMQNTAYAGLVYHLDSWYYVSNGVVNWTTGLVDHFGTLYYVSSGKMDTGFAGLVEYNGQQYYAAYGAAAVSYTGFALCGEDWYYVVNGIVAEDYSGLLALSGSIYYVVNGKLNTDYAGLVDHYGTKYYVACGVVAASYTGLALHDGSWYYITYGLQADSYTGLLTLNGSIYYVVNGALANYSGLVEHGGSWYYVSGGIVADGYTGLALHGGSWYYVSNGVLNRDYVGLVESGGSLFYVTGGVINWGFSGTVDGYRVENGMVVS